MPRSAAAGLLALALAAAAPAGATPRPGDLCVEAARAAAARHGVPAEVMLAITVVETGTTRHGHRGPWPWTLNIAGAGAWFDSRAEARRAAERALAAGTRSVDLGCFQINHRWHGAHFPDAGAMLDPAAGADYAARFLAGLRAEAGDWTTAIGWYHSRTPVHADRYRGAVRRAMAAIGPADAARAAVATARPGPAALWVAAGPIAAGGLPVAQRAREPAPPGAPGLAPGAPPTGGVRLTILTGAAGGLLRAGRPGG